MSTTARFGSQDDAQWASLGDFIRHNPGARRRRRLVRNAVERLACDRDQLDILDVGCGPGEPYLTRRELRTPIRYDGLDLSAAAIQSAQEHHADGRWTLHDRFDGALDEQHDIAICSDVTERVGDATYGRFARLTNSVTCGVTAAGSLPTSPWDPQYVRVSRRS